MEKKWQITITEKGDKINFEFERTKFSATEMLGLLELLRDNIICLMKGKQRQDVDTLNAFKNAMKGEQHPEAEQE